MKELNLHTRFVLKHFDELDESERRLVEEARKATYRSYSPYSRFSVGAAVELDDGSIVSGSNQENAAYPSGLCAERTAVFYAHSQYPDHAIRRICIAARGTDGQPVKQPITPCGACRQVLLESEQRARNPIKLLLYGTEGILVIESVKDLLPLSFGSEALNGTGET